MPVTVLRAGGRLAASVLTVAAASALLVGGPIPTASAQGCSDVELIFARGTSEPAGIGRVGQALADALRPQLGGMTLSTYGVNYPATYDFLTTAAGANDVTARIASVSAQCPGTRFVLGGYSQGAAVIDMLAGVPPLGNRIGDIGSAPPLPGNYADDVAAVAVFGNPAAKFGSPLSARGQFAGRSVDACGDGDPICSDGRNPFAHTHYESSPFIGQAAGFVAGRI
ncbi:MULTISPECIES: cutinase family protein [Mycobacteriaceae]|uniref:cutinase family protein n=1 Tax=Mycobacteriaceae TaxID=1762 RepID=UPI0007FC7419|nr:MULTISPECIES: cutinase family protein [Mycobacteriaceae]MCK0173635.1 cutinase family protein [Mycolicibacterium sp. F2034L]OBB57279.1 cutinase [Mycobacterium sp. 852013-51886_SCH5428379]